MPSSNSLVNVIYYIYEKNNTDFSNYNSNIKFLIYFWLSRRANESIRVFIKNTWKYHCSRNFTKTTNEKKSN